MRWFLIFFSIINLFNLASAQEKNIQLFLSKSFISSILEDNQTCSSSINALFKNTSIEIKCNNELLKTILIQSLRIGQNDEIISKKPEYEYRDRILKIKLISKQEQYDVESIEIDIDSRPKALLEKIFAHLIVDSKFVSLDKPIRLFQKYRPFSPPSYTLLGTLQWNITQFKNFAWENSEKPEEVTLCVNWDIWNVSWVKKEQDMTIYSYPDEKFRLTIEPKGRECIKIKDIVPVLNTAKDINDKCVDHLKKLYKDIDLSALALKQNLYHSPLLQEIVPDIWPRISSDGQFLLLQNTKEKIRTELDVDLSPIKGKDIAILIQHGVAQRILQGIQPDPVLGFLAIVQKIPQEDRNSYLRLSIHREILGKSDKRLDMVIDLPYASEEEKNRLLQFCDISGITCKFQNNRIFLGGEILLLYNKRLLAKVKNIECSIHIKYSSELNTFLFLPEKYKEPDIVFYDYYDKETKNYRRLHLLFTSVWEIMSWILEKASLTVIERYWQAIIRYTNQDEKIIQTFNHGITTLGKDNTSCFVIYGNIKKN